MECFNATASPLDDESSCLWGRVRFLYCVVMAVLIDVVVVVVVVVMSRESLWHRESCMGGFRQGGVESLLEGELQGGFIQGGSDRGIEWPCCRGGLQLNPWRSESCRGLPPCGLLLPCGLTSPSFRGGWRSDVLPKYRPH